MSSLVNGLMRSAMQVIYTNAASGTGRQSLADSALVQFTDGTGDNQANRLYRTDPDVSIAASGSLSLTLSALTDLFGTAIAATSIRAITINHRLASLASEITIGGGTHAVFGTQIVGLPLANGDFFQWTARKGYTVAVGSTDVLKIINSDSVNAATVRIGILLAQ